MAVKTRTRLGNKMQPSGAKTIQPAQKAFASHGPKDFLTRDDYNSKIERIHAAISTNRFVDFAFHMSMILQSLK